MFPFNIFLFYIQYIYYIFCIKMEKKCTFIMISPVWCTCSKTKPALNFLADWPFLSTVSTVTICLTTIMHVAEEEVKAVHFDATVGSLPGSSAPRWLIPVGGEVLRQTGPEENQICLDSGPIWSVSPLQSSTDRSYETQSCLFHLSK